MGVGDCECTGGQQLCFVLVSGNSAAVGVGLYSCLCHDDFTPNGDIFIICVHKYINIGTKECLSLARW